MPPPRRTQSPKATTVRPNDCDPALHSDLSRPLREQPLIWPPTETEHEANLNPKLPHQHQDGPDPVIQSSFWRTLIGIPAIPSPILQWAGIAFPGRRLQLRTAGYEWRGGKDSIRPDGQRKASRF